MPLVVSAAGAGMWGRSTKKMAVPGSLDIPMQSRFSWGCAWTRCMGRSTVFSQGLYQMQNFLSESQEV